METRNSKILKEFIKYCEEHPNERFWQALRNFSNSMSILRVDNDRECKDTFYFENKED